METPEVKPEAFQYRHGWTGEARHDATERVIEAMRGHDDLLPAAEAAAEAFREILRAESVSISVIMGENYRELVNVGSLYGQERFPDHQVYPMTMYPAATERLLAGRGYLSTSKALDVIQEFIEHWPHPVDGGFMGVPIVAAGEVRGEIWALRAPDAPPFIAEDLDLVADLATQFGSRLPALLDRQRAVDPDW